MQITVIKLDGEREIDVFKNIWMEIKLKYNQFRNEFEIEVVETHFVEIMEAVMRYWDIGVCNCTIERESFNLVNRVDSLAQQLSYLILWFDEIKFYFVSS